MKVKTIEEIENIMKTILLMFYNSVKLKFFPGKYDITQHNTIWICRNFTIICFHGIYMDVTFMTAEQWMVPYPIQYELLSLPQNLEFPFSGINLDPKFVCLQTKLVCYHSMGNVNEMAEMISLMNNFFRENTFTTQSSCIYLNMFTYCQIKAEHHRKTVKSILKYLRIFPSRYNTALGYLKIVLQIRYYLSVRLLIIQRVYYLHISNTHKAILHVTIYIYIYIYIYSEYISFWIKKSYAKNRYIDTRKQKKWIAEFYVNLVCRFSNNNVPIFLNKRRDSVINAVLLLSSIFSICLIYNVSFFSLLYLISFLNFHINQFATKKKKKDK